MNVDGALGQDEKLRMVNVSLWAAFASAILLVSSVFWGQSFDGRALWMATGFALSLLLICRVAAWRLEVGSWFLCALLFGVVTFGILLTGSPVTAGFIVVVLLAFLLLGPRAALLFGAASVVAAGGMMGMFLAEPALSRWAMLALAIGWVALVLHFYDTSIRRTESALRHSEDLMRSVMEGSRDHIMRLDADATIVFINRTVSGLTVEQVLGTSIYDYVDPKYRPEMKACFARVFETGQQDSYYVDYESPDGILAFETRVAPITIDGELVGLTLSSSNVTKRVETDAQLRRLASLVENSGDFIGIADLEGKMLFVNRAGLEMVGLASSDAIEGTTLEDYVLEADREKLRKEVLPYLHDIGAWRGAYHFRHFGDGPAIPVEVHSFLVLDDKTGEPFSIATINRDVSEREEADAALALSEGQLRQAQKMEAVGMLAGGVAHDFNNLLTVISGYTDLVIHTEDLSPKGRERLEGVVTASERATSLTRQLLAFSRRQVLQPRVLDLNVLLRDMERMLSRMIGEDIRLETSFLEDCGNLKADPGQIEQVIMNLAINARDAMPSGGVLRLEIANSEFGLGGSPTDGPPMGDFVILSVSDTGLGMDREVLGHIFEPFFTTKELGRGTGLGLSTVYGIVKQSGGYIYARSELGSGTTFDVYLPRVPDPVTVVELAAPSVRGGSETILVVEDDEGVRALTCEVLEERGYDVVAASDGDHAMEIVRRKQLEAELLITDVVMPRMNGRELAGRLRDQRPELKVLYMSGYSARVMSHRGLVQDEAQLLQKPFTPRSLADKVREVLDGVPVRD